MNEALTKSDSIDHNRRRFYAYSATQGNNAAIQFIMDDGVYNQWLTNQSELFSVEIGKDAEEWNVKDHVRFTNRLEEIKP